MGTQIDKIKRRLGIKDTLQDDLLGDLIEDAEAQFLAITGAEAVLSKYSFIITDVVCMRYARKGSEGVKSESVDGYSVTYDTDDFNSYMWLLNKDFNLDDKSLREKGGFYFV
ncbi:phage head-tail connector protein [Ignavigranum ruoffiae]|uniref:phage head-tail connector protein n=1 Tax=Ignavigranum ruoffiae TaxID=89093 RepID=UPI0020530705|nr:phage head-tail connector protein [Ignavigranum ruoffiae]UPQ86424.1 phage head-tail connector protein [Ignavigranum ruoffiae]